MIRATTTRGKLTPNEAAILRRMLMAGGAFVAKEVLFGVTVRRQVDYDPDAGTKLVDVYVCRMRRHLPPGAILTRWGFGYALRDLDAARALLGDLAEDHGSEAEKLKQAIAEALAAFDARQPREAEQALRRVAA